MMPVQTDGPEDFKAKYKTLKRKLKLLIYENECFQEELRKAQRALLRVRRDKSFLLDRLLQYQRGPDSSSDSEQTEESDTEVEAKLEVKTCRKRLSLDGSGGSGSSHGAVGKPPSKKKKSSSSGGGSGSSKSSKHSSKHVSVSSSVVASGGGGSLTLQHQVAGSGIVGGSSTPAAIQAQRKLHSASGSLASGVLRRPGGGQVQGSDGQLSREEVERRLAARQPMSDFTTTAVSLTLPNQLFSDNIMEGDFMEEEVETSPSNIDDDVTVDNYD